MPQLPSGEMGRRRVGYEGAGSEEARQGGEMRAFAVLLLLAVAPVFGQIPDMEKTDGHFNGRWWREHSELERYSYLAGLIQGLHAAKPASKAYDLVMPTGVPLTFGEVIKSIDGIYREPLNGRLPIMAVMQIVKVKAEGGTPEAVEALTLIWRKDSAEVKPATPEVTKQ